MEGLNRGLPRLGIGKANGSNLKEHIKKLQLKEERGRESLREKGEKDGELQEGKEKEAQLVYGGCKEERGFKCSCGHKTDSLSLQTESISLEF